MLVRSAIAPRHKNAPRPAEKSAPGYLQWIRGRPCACMGRFPECGGRMEAAHGPDKASKGVGTKCRDSAAIPLSSNCHREQHRIGWQSYALRYLPFGDALKLAAEYWRLWPGRRAWEAKQNA